MWACLRVMQVWERPAIAVGHLPTGEKWAKGYDLQLRFYDIQQYPEVCTHALCTAARMQRPTAFSGIPAGARLANP